VNGCLNKSLTLQSFSSEICLTFVEVLLFIFIITTSTSEFSKYSSFTRFFDEDMKQHLFIMMDMVREMSTELRE